MNALRNMGAPAVAAVGVLGLAYALLAAAALAGSPLTFALGAVGAYAASVFLRLRAKSAASVLSRFRVGSTTQALLRQVLLLGLIGTAGAAAEVPLWTAIAAIVAVFALQLGYDVLLRRTRRFRKMPVVTRNIDLDPLDIDDGPPRWMVVNAVHHLLLVDAPLVAGTVGFLLTGTVGMMQAGAAVSVLLALAALAAMVPHYLAARRLAADTETMEYVQTWIDGYRPEVLLYFSGSESSAYQVDMWLEPLERLTGRRPLVVLRERAVAAALAPTGLPVLCVPKSTELMALDFGPARVALYPANTGKSIHLLRNPRMRHVFIGHGDSDKVASVNPFSKVYDEVWTAGTGGRERYELAGVGVRDDEIVEVGRPQLDSISRTATTGPVPTVLYAPTWEGWTDEPGNTSIIEAGPALVELLLHADPPLRVLYKPHPFTGIRDPRARAAHRTIVGLIERAGRGARGSGPGTGARRLADIQRRLAAVENLRRGRDEARGSRDDGGADTGEVDESRRLDREWHRLYWLGRAPREHLVIEGRRPGLYSCFDQADLLITDISSVAADFIASGKPYAVTNCEGIPDLDFRTVHPTAAAAYLLRPDGTGLREALRALADPEADVYAGTRAKLRVYLLGAEQPPAHERFESAVEELYRRAVEAIPLEDPRGTPVGADNGRGATTPAGATAGLVPVQGPAPEPVFEGAADEAPRSDGARSGRGATAHTGSADPTADRTTVQSAGRPRP